MRRVAPTLRSHVRYGDINFAVAQPLGDFSDFIGAGYGLTGGFVWNFDRDRVFGIRAEGGFVQYGSERTSVCPFGCRVNVDVNTDNDIVFAGVGPQITCARRVRSDRTSMQRPA